MSTSDAELWPGSAAIAWHDSIKRDLGSVYHIANEFGTARCNPSIRLWKKHGHRGGTPKYGDYCCRRCIAILDYAEVKP